MEYSLSLPEPLYAELTAHLFQDDRQERAAYLLCRSAIGRQEIRLLGRELIPVEAAHIQSVSRVHMRIASPSFLRAMKRAHQTQQSFVFVHSHPHDVPGHSPQDNREEVSLFRTAHVRIGGVPIHGSLVLSAPDKPVGRVWLADGCHHPISTIRVVGERLRLFRHGTAIEPNISLFDRQVRAFGNELQSLLAQLRIGIVGAGGTGSAVCEQLTRLGVGEIIIADGQALDASNVTRVYGSRLADQGRPKVHIQRDHVSRIGLDTVIHTLEKDITYRSVLEEFRFCDAVFGCTDDQWGRSLLTRLAIYYHVPVLDMGVKIDSTDGAIRSVQGRVTTLLAGVPCLFCRGRITAEGVRAESIALLNPAEAEQLRREGYAPELEEAAPAVIPFTTAIASSAVCELLHRLTGFMGSERRSTEVLHLFDQTRTRTNGGRSASDCFCQDRTFWGRGDVEPFLDLTWRPE
jgi:molybdopterin/thiamine biosynthesis adenylyltransferase